jgi:hypothetical protein
LGQLERVLFDGLSELILVFSVDVAQLIIKFAFPILQHALGLLHVLDEWSLLLLQEDGRLDELFPTICKVPDQDAFGACSP